MEFWSGTNLGVAKWVPGFHFTSKSTDHKEHQLDAAKGAARDFIASLESDIWDQYVDMDPERFWALYRSKGLTTPHGAAFSFVDENKDRISQMNADDPDRMSPGEIAKILGSRLRKYLAQE